MTRPTFAGPWIKASALASLTAFRLTDVVIASRNAYKGAPIIPTVVCQYVSKPRTQDPINAVISFWQERHRLTIGRDEATAISENIRLVFTLLDEEARRIDAALPAPRQTKGGA